MTDTAREVAGIGTPGTLYCDEVIFETPAPGINTARQPIAGCGWVTTDEGVVLIDTLLTPDSAEKVAAKITDPIKYIIYTHGHCDHVGGARAFLKDNPEIIASKYLPDRLDRYKMLGEYRDKICHQQFNVVPRRPAAECRYVRPTKTFLGDMTISLGGITFELHTARAETDDVCWVHVPKLKAAFIGDLIIGCFPNVGNPWKPTRFALDWAKTLEEVRELDLDVLFYNGAGNCYKGNDIRDALDANIEVIRSLHDQVVDCINRGVHITEMIHEIAVPDHLKDNKFISPRYSKTEFFVYNVYRWYHGYFDDNPANLLPRPEKEIMAEIFGLIGDPERIINRARGLHNDGKSQLALQVLDVLIQGDPDNTDARKLRIELLETLGKDDGCLMSRNAWIYFINQDKEFLRSKTSPA